MLHPLQYPSQSFQGLVIISYCPTPTTAWRICIPNNQLLVLMRWYHQVLGHPGIHWLRNLIATHFYHLQLRATVNDVIKHCKACQINKLTGPGYGQLPSWEATALPFQEVAIYLIGPWWVTLPNETYEFYALTCIDLATNFEAIRIRNKTASHVGMQFKNIWRLSHYPRPQRCRHDQGTKFIGSDFQYMLIQSGIKDFPTTVWKPQANTICEWLHQSIANTLWIL
jgi:transposase InsO family protein